MRPPGAWGRRPPAKPANENEVTTGSDTAKPTPTINPNPENLSTKEKAKPAHANVVTTGFGVESTGLDVENPKRIPSAGRPPTVVRIGCLQIKGFSRSAPCFFGALRDQSAQSARTASSPCGLFCKSSGGVADLLRDFLAPPHSGAPALPRSGLVSRK